MSGLSVTLLLSLCAVARVRAAQADVTNGTHCRRGGASACAASSPSGRSSDDAVLLQRSKRQVDADVLQRENFTLDAPEEYDCNGDGVPDCGTWDRRAKRCSNPVYCGRQYKFGDWGRGQSCRCLRCAGRAVYGTAFGDPQLQNPSPSVFNARPWGTFRVWDLQFDTCAPWIMPRTDVDLRRALDYARERGYKVRISGTSHSSGGLVTDGRDTNTFVISLAEYTASGKWEFGLHDMPDGSKRATVNAGWTQANLFQRIRPLGYFPPAQSAGPLFSLGGIVANTVHGAGYSVGFMYSYVTRMRVMSHDGSIRIIEDEEELRHWRCSFGLLGIILGVELQLEQRSQLQMYTVRRTLSAWNKEQFWRFIKHDAEADLPEDVGEEGGAGSRASFNGEFFVDWRGPTMDVFAQKANSSVDPEFDGQLGMPDDVEAGYRSIMNRRVEDDLHGAMTWGEAARREGAPPLAAAGGWSLADSVRYVSNLLNDGFQFIDTPILLLLAYFVPPSKAFEAIDMLLRAAQRMGFGVEFRFVRAQDSAVLQPMKKGLWFNAQLIAAGVPNDDTWKQAFQAVEEEFVQELGGKPHMGKFWGFGADQNGNLEPFADEFACRIYSDATKARFSAYRERQDPGRLFFAGLGVKLLSPCN